MDLFEHNPGILAAHHDEHIFDQATGKIQAATLLQNLRAAAQWGDIPAAGNCTALRRELIEVLLPFPDGVFYDWWINKVPEALNARLVLDEPLQIWRRHCQNESEPLVAGPVPSKFAIFWRFGRGDPRPGWEMAAMHLSIVRDRICERASAIDVLLEPDAAARAIARLDLDIGRIECRIAASALPHWRRIPRVARMLRNGDYATFSGWRSAAKDMLRW